MSQLLIALLLLRGKEPKYCSRAALFECEGPLLRPSDAACAPQTAKKNKPTFLDRYAIFIREQQHTQKAGDLVSATHTAVYYVLPVSHTHMRAVQFILYCHRSTPVFLGGVLRPKAARVCTAV